MQIDFFVLESAPQSFCEDVISGAPAAIHTDFDICVLQALQILGTGEVTALIAVPDFRLGLKQGIVDRGENEIQLKRLAKRPAEDVTGIPVQHRGQVQPARL